MAANTEALQEALDQKKRSDQNFGKYLPTIFVACGGTGAKVFQRIRRLSLERFGSVVGDDLPGVAYISIDTDVDSKNANSQGENFGEVAKLLDFRTEERLDLNGSRIKNYVENEETLKNHAHVAEWFEPQLMHVSKGMDLKKGAGQIRPIARLVAFDNSEQIVQLFTAALSRVTAIRGDDKRVIAGNKVNVVICGSLAGGTGAGIFLDVAAMIRNSAPDVTITGAFVLPDVFRGKETPKKIQANGYACLSELAYFTTEPFRANYPGAKEVTISPAKPMFDGVYLYEGANSEGLSAASPDAVYDVIGNSFFLSFFQGEFAWARNSTESNRSQYLLKVHKDRVFVTTNINSKTEVRVDFESYRQRFMSSGMSRVSTPAWRLINSLSYDLACELIDVLDNPQELVKAEGDLKREFAQKLGIWQGEVVTEDGRIEHQRLVETALMENPSATGHRTIGDAIGAHFADLTTQEALLQWFEERTCGQEMRKKWLTMADQWNGAFDDGVKGALVDKVLTNRRAMFKRVVERLQPTIEEFCERPDVGPDRIAKLMSRLVTDMRNVEVYWIKEMEKGAERARTDAEARLGDWNRWITDAADVDSSFTARLQKGAWMEHMKRAQDAAVAHWNAIARRVMYTEAAGMMREVCNYIEREGIERQVSVARKLREIHGVFGRFRDDYSRDVSSEVFQVISRGDNDVGLDKLRLHFLGDTEQKRKVSLMNLYNRVLTTLGIVGANKNRALRERIETQKDRFVLDFRRCCWLSLKGSNGTTDWFGEPRAALVEKNAVLDVMQHRFGTTDSPELKELAEKTLKNAMPWVKLHPNMSRVDGVVTDCYVVLPDGENKAVADAFYEFVKNACVNRGIRPARCRGSEASEIVIYVETYGLVPAHFSSLWGMTGLEQSYRDLIAKKKNGDAMAFLHIDRDIVRFPRLIPLQAGDAGKMVESWKLFLNGVITGVVRTTENELRRGFERNAHPNFRFEHASSQSNKSLDLGQARTAVDDLGDNSALRESLTQMVNLQYVGQVKSRYERLLALVRYYKYCVFPVRRVQHNDGHDEPTTYPVAWAALDKLEGDLVLAWLNCGSLPDPQSAREDLMKTRVPQLMLKLEEFAEHTGIRDEDAGLVSGLLDDEYFENPPNVGAERSTDTERRETLRLTSFKLLPESLRLNPALASQSRVYPWLQLSVRYKLYLPSQHGGRPGDVREPGIESKLEEFSIREAVAWLRDNPADAHGTNGAKVWYVPPGKPRGELLAWTTISKLKEAYQRDVGAIDTSVAPAEVSLTYHGPATPQPVSQTVTQILAHLQAAPGANHFVLEGASWVDAKEHPAIKSRMPAVPGIPALPGLVSSPATPPLPGFGAPSVAVATYTYAGSMSPQGSTLSAADIVAQMRAHPAATHFVLVNGAWAAPTAVPDIAAALSGGLPPLPGGLPPLPGALPPLPSAVALPPVPTGPFHYTGAAHREPARLSGEQVVALAVAAQPGAEGHVVVNDAWAPVMEVPDLAAAITARRR